MQYLSERNRQCRYGASLQQEGGETISVHAVSLVEERWNSSFEMDLIFSVK